MSQKKPPAPEITRRGWLGALAGVAAAIASVSGSRPPPETVAEKRRRRRFWVGHS